MTKTFKNKQEHFAWVQKKIAEKRELLKAAHPEWDFYDLYFDHYNEWGDISENELDGLAYKEGYDPEHLF